MGSDERNGNSKSPTIAKKEPERKTRANPPNGTPLAFAQKSGSAVRNPRPSSVATAEKSLRIHLLKRSPPVPPGWAREAVFEGKMRGRMRYLNLSTETYTWTHPSLPSKWLELIDLEYPKHPEIRVYYQDPNGKCTWEHPTAAPLPQGWTENVESEKGRVFFVDHNTKTTTWKD